MTIKSKLTFLFFVLVGIIIVTVTWLVSSLYLQRKYFLSYVQTQEKLTFIENIIQDVSFQRLYFDYYILFGEEKDKENFLAISNRVKNLCKEAFGMQDSIYLSYIDVIETANKTFNETKHENKVAIATTEFLPKYENLINLLRQQERNYSKHKKNLERLVSTLNIASFIISFIVIFVAVIMITKYGVRIYRAVMRSLNVIRKFAQILSQGEYKTITYRTDDEFADVISAFNHMVESLKNLQAQIIQMDRLSNIGQLAGGIAHELNNPLVGVLGQAQILLEKLPKDSPLREHVEKIERAAQRCKESVSKLLQFSRQKEYEYTEVDINEVVKNVLFIADSELKANNIEVITLFSNNLPKLRLSVPHMQQAFLNIVNNAIQAMAEKVNKKVLYIKSYMIKEEKDNKLNPYVVVEFQDTGCGIEKQNLNLIFEPFFTTKDRNKFAGMGLAITRDIILHHKGKISVFSEGVNKGAKFTIYLPCHENV